MRILQVVTFISPDGAYGGPVRVAVNQAKALTALGHDVVVAAAADGFEGSLPAEFDGFSVRLFPARKLVPKVGFAGLTSPGLLHWLTHAIQAADVVHVHLARDLVSLPAAAIALLAGKPLVVQTHGMIDRTNKKLAVPLDRLLTRPILRRAIQVLYLTDRERQDLVHVAGEQLALMHLPNGVTVPDTQAIEQIEGVQKSPEVLFLARLHSRKRPLYFARAAVTLARRWPHASFSIVGPDEGEGAAVTAAIAEKHPHAPISWSGSMEPARTLARMGCASVYALPSTDEPFPMAVLEAMSIGVPVVVTQSCGLAPFVVEHQAGVVCDHSQESLNEALEKLLANPELRITMGTNARAAVQKSHSMHMVASRLLQSYGDAMRQMESRT
ncbi:glycosyltransferase [Kocuria rosea]|uniref:glycosyltransferase n=1 Tax=Kocuria rosea TaxID=1275 RepID=UPI0030176D5A